MATHRQLFVTQFIAIGGVGVECEIQSLTPLWIAEMLRYGGPKDIFVEEVPRCIVILFYLRTVLPASLDKTIHSTQCQSSITHATIQIGAARLALAVFDPSSEGHILLNNRQVVNRTSYPRSSQIQASLWQIRI